MMKVMVLVKANEDSENGVMPSEELLTEMGKYNEELVSAGIMLDGDGLRPSSKATRVEFSPEGAPTVTDGPFAETKELVAGYWVWQVKDRDEAIEWARRIPNTDKKHGIVEIREFVTAEDFGLSPDQTRKIEELRDQVGNN